MQDTVLKSPKSKEEEEENILMFLDSLDSYVTLFDSLTSSLRKGWLDLASARHSMGSLRISSSLLDLRRGCKATCKCMQVAKQPLKVQSAATTLQVSESIKGSQSELYYTLSKWASLRENKYLSREDAGELRKSNTSQLRHRGLSHLSDGSHDARRASSNGTSPNPVDNNDIQRERSKSLAVFGTLVSPKLRSAQVSFVTALETIVEIANMRSSMLSALSRLQKEKKGQTEVEDG